jgi:hypothetical protein
VAIKMTKIPYIGSAFSFPLDVAHKAFKELAFLWFISSLPLIFSIIGKVLNGVALRAAILNEVNAQALFLYTSAFLAPVLYLTVDRLFPRKTKIFDGAYLIMITTFGIWFFSCWAYQNEKINLPESLGLKILWIYGISIYFWFLAICDARFENYDYEHSVTTDENDFAARAALKDRRG